MKAIEPATIESLSRDLIFLNSNKERPNNNQRILIYLGNREENWLKDLGFCSAVYIEESARGGRSEFILDCGGVINVHDGLPWAKFPQSGNDFQGLSGDFK